MRFVLKKMQSLWAFLYYCLSTLFMTWPLALHLKDSVIGGMGDNIYFVWLIRWYQKVFLEGQGHPFFNPWMNYPQGWNLSTTETSLASALPGVPFSYFFGPIAGYNVAVLLTFVLAGFFMYLWIRELTQSSLAGLVAGTIYAFSPYHIAHFLVGHLNLCGIEWFPLYFWGLHNLLKSKVKFDWKSVLLTGLSLGLIAFTSMYYLYMTLLFSAVFIIGYLCFSRFIVFGEKYFWLQAVAAAVISSPFVYFSLRPFINLANAGTLASRSMEYASMYSASPTDFFLPSSDHFLFGTLVSKWFDRSLWNESSLYIGLAALVLALIAVVLNKKSQHRGLIENLAKQGVLFTDLLHAQEQYPAILERILNQAKIYETDKFAAMSAAFCSNGVLLYVPKGVTVDKPLHSLFWTSGSGILNAFQVFVWLDENSSVTYVHENASPETSTSQNLHAGLMDIRVGKGAKLNLVELQSYGSDDWNFTHEKVNVEAEAAVDWIFGSLGSHLTKNFSDLNLVGQGSSGKMSGFYFTNGNQHLDHDTQQNHLAPNTTSDLLFKGALVGESRSVWQGMIYVAENASKTDGYQANRNLVLSKKARADSIPGLEILTDDVRCTHGATVGKIDTDMVFYLESRGIPRKEAEKLIVEGFFDPIMQRIPFAGVKNRFQTAIEEKMSEY